MQEKVKSLLSKFESRRGKIDLSLTRIDKFLNKLGSPHHKLPKTIHIAGTNGKGSTLAFLRAMLEADGKTCHVYSSPHLVRFNERITLAGEEISDEYLYEILAEVDKAAEGEDVTFFEITTAAALLAYSRVEADYLLLETGLGGRLDATNVVPEKLLTIITPISFDHMEFLGNTLGAIAGEKAAIMRAGVPCVSAPQDDEAKASIEKTANNIGAKLVFAEVDNSLNGLSLPGEHQKINASVAIECAKIIGVPDAAIKRGLQTARWRGRLQKITKGPLAELLKDGSELWLDGAHNEAGAKALSEFFRGKDKPVYMILGMMQRKEPRVFLEYFKGVVDRVYAIPINTTEPFYDHNELAKAAAELGFESKAAGSAQEALAAINERASILITGSLYLAGNILEQNS